MNLFYYRSGCAVEVLNNFHGRALLITLLLILVMSPLYAQVPTITNVSPLAGPIGTSVTITGTNFSATAANNTVFFGAVKGTVTAASATTLTVTVPSGATEQPVSVSVDGLMVASYFVFHVTFSGGTLEMGTPVGFPSGSLPKTALIADLDGDGKSDLLTINNGSNTISVFRNQSGSGTITPTSFADKVDLDTEVAPVGLVVGDLDGDNKPDVVALSTNMSKLSVFKNTSSSGTVSFATRLDIGTASSPRGVAIGDLDRDGKPELVVVGNNNVYIYKNLSTTGTINNGSFPTNTSFPVNNTPEFVLVDDVDNDGKLDLVVSSNSTMGTAVLRNTFTGTTFSFAAKVSVAAGTGVYGNIILTDLDGDGRRDMVQSKPGTSLFYVSRNISLSNFLVEFEPYFTVVTSIEDLSCVAAGDVDGDGKPDLVVGSAKNRILIFKNLASSGFLDRTSLSDQPVEFALDIPSTDVSSVAVGDLNADSKPDVLASYNLGSKLLVLQNGLTSAPTVPQTVTFDPIASPKPYGTVFDLIATASSGLPVTFSSSDPGIIAVNGSSATVVGIGTATITASQNGDLVYSAATPVTRSVTTVKADQTISWGLGFSPKTFGDPDFTFTSTTTSNLPLTFTSSNTAVATISGKTLHIVGAGTSNITVSQAGNAFYNAAPTLTLELTVLKANQTITFGDIANKFVDAPDFTLNATASSGLTVSYASSNTAVATVTGNSVNIIGAGTTTITASQAGNTNYNAAAPKATTITVIKREQAITFEEIGIKGIGEADFQLNATATSGLPVSYNSSNVLVATVSGNIVHIAGEGTTTITASQDGNTVFAAAPAVARTLTVQAIVGTEDETSAVVSIYPNPATDRITITTTRFNQHVDADVALVDMYGRVVLREALRSNSDSQVEVNISSLDDGLYIVQVSQGTLGFRNRLIKIR